MKTVYATADEFLDDYQREATRYAVERLAVLADSEDIVTAADYAKCDYPGPFEECPKCHLLTRVLARINEEQDVLTAALRAADKPKEAEA